MSERPYRVHVVVDPHYGERIRDLPVREPAWIVDSPDNHPAIHALWDARKRLDQYTGITSFKYDPDARAEDWLISTLPVLDEHYCYHDPPYSVLNIIGTSWSEAIQEELDLSGFSEHKDTAEGFTARRDIHEQPRGRCQQE